MIQTQIQNQYIFLDREVTEEGLQPCPMVYQLLHKSRLPKEEGEVTYALVHVFQCDYQVSVSINGHIRYSFFLAERLMTNEMIWTYDHVIPLGLFTPGQYTFELKTAFDYLFMIWNVLTKGLTCPLRQVVSDHAHVFDLHAFDSCWLTQSGTLIGIQFRPPAGNHSWKLTLTNRMSIVHYQPQPCGPQHALLDIPLYSFHLGAKSKPMTISTLDSLAQLV